MRKRIWQVLMLVSVGILLTGCGLKGKLGQLLQPKGEEEKQEQPKVEEVSYAIDQERYKEYVEVLEDILEDNEWPDGGAVVEEEMIYYGDVSFAICDVDMDGAEELLVESSDVSIAGMITRVFDYDAKKGEVVEEYSGFPGMDFLNNGLLYQPMSHNQTGGDAIYPHDLYKYNQKEDSYDWVAHVYCVEAKNSYSGYTSEADADNDGIIYYVLEEIGGYPGKAYTKDEYDAWYEKTVGKTNDIYIPWENLYDRNVENLEYIATVEGAVKGRNIATETKITQYDINANGKRDRIELRVDERSYEFNEPGWGKKWSLLINDKVMFTYRDDWGITLEVEFYQVSSKRTYLYVKQEAMYNGYVENVDIYQFQDGEMVEQLECYKTITDNSKGSYPDVVVKSLTPGELVLEGSSQLNATSNVEWLMKYAYQESEGKWKLSSGEFPIVGRWWEDDHEDGWHAKTSIKVYKKWDSNEVAFTINKGDVIYLDAIRHHQGRTYFKARTTDGKEGWFADPDDASIYEDGMWDSGYFEEAMFAG